MDDTRHSDQDGVRHHAVGRVLAVRRSRLVLLMGLSVALLCVLAALPASPHASPPDPTSSGPLSTAVYLPRVAIEVPASINLAWTSVCLECPGLVGSLTDRALRLDSAGHPHIAYGGEGLYYTTFDGVAWHRQAVDRVPSSDPALALDSQGLPHIAYHQATTGNMMYAHWNGHDWIIQTVDQRAFGSHASLALDGADMPYVAYRGRNVLKVGHLNGTGWELHNLDIVGDDGGYASLAMDAAGVLHAAYYRGFPNYDLRYARLSNSTWSKQIVDGEAAAGRFASLAVNANGRPYISYCDFPRSLASGECWGLKLAWWNGSAWVVEVIDAVDNVALHSSLSLDQGGRPLVTYWAGPGDGLKIARKVGTGWIKQSVDNTPAEGRYTSLALGSDGRSHIAYLDGGRQALRYAYGVNSSWILSTVDGGQDGTPRHTLVLDESDVLHASYHDSSSGDLRYARWTGDSWVAFSVDSAASMGEATALAVGSARLPQVSYVADGELRHARWDGSSWGISVVDAVVEAEASLSLALGAGNSPHLAYFAAGELRHASRIDDTWTVDVVDALAGAPDCLSLALDRLGSAHLVYAGHGELRHARRAGDAWEIETIGQVLAPLCGNLILDSLNTPHVSFSSAGTLRYAMREGESWTIQTADDELGIDRTASSLALDVGGFPHISYFGDPTPRYVRWDGQGWRVQPLDEEASGAGGAMVLNLQGGADPHIVYYDKAVGRLASLRGRSDPQLASSYLPMAMATPAANQYACPAASFCGGGFACVDVTECGGYSLAASCQLDAAAWWADILADYDSSFPIRFELAADDRYCFRSTLQIVGMDDKVFSARGAARPAYFLAESNLGRMLDIVNSNRVGFESIHFQVGDGRTVDRMVVARDSHTRIADSQFEDCNLGCVWIIRGVTEISRAIFRSYYGALVLQDVSGGHVENGAFDNSHLWAGYENVHITSYNLQNFRISGNTFRSRDLGAGMGAHAISILGNAHHLTIVGNDMDDLNDMGIWLANRGTVQYSGCFAEDESGNPLPPHHITITNNRIGRLFAPHLAIELCGHQYGRWCGQSTYITVTDNIITGNAGARVTQSADFDFDEETVICPPPCRWEYYGVPSQ